MYIERVGVHHFFMVSRMKNREMLDFVHLVSLHIPLHWSLYIIHFHYSVSYM